jgi:hypothetical protein
MFQIGFPYIFRKTEIAILSRTCLLRYNNISSHTGRWEMVICLTVSCRLHSFVIFSFQVEINGWKQKYDQFAEDHKKLLASSYAASPVSESAQLYQQQFGELLCFYHCDWLQQIQSHLNSLKTHAGLTRFLLLSTASHLVLSQ